MTSLYPYPGKKTEGLINKGCIGLIAGGWPILGLMS